MLINRGADKDAVLTNNGTPQKIPWMEESGRLQSMESLELDTIE